MERSLFKTDEGRDISNKSYDRAMELWPTDFEEQWVDTRYGTTHVIVSGPEDGSPLFLIPGLFADATMWYANAGALAEHYRVYCLDMITYGGKGTPSEIPISTGADYAVWFGEILGHYGIDRAAVAGLSYGSWTALAIAGERPGIVSALVLLDPSESFVRMDGGIAWRGFWSFVVFPNRAKYARFFDWIGGGYSDPQMDVWFEHMLDVIEHGSTRMDQVPQGLYTREQLMRVTMPTLIMAGGKPIIYKSPKKLAVAASEALPQAVVDVVPGTGHGLNMEKPDYVNGRILSFLEANYQ